ncbi:hypothetical protein HK405_004637 [Cladochytrium tenue]|nr:hypothetical protein HK405_004637 [Cladochytrium tenue]
MTPVRAKQSTVRLGNAFSRGSLDASAPLRTMRGSSTKVLADAAYDTIDDKEDDDDDGTATAGPPTADSDGLSGLIDSTTPPAISAAISQLDRLLGADGGWDSGPGGGVGGGMAPTVVAMAEVVAAVSAVDGD